MAITRRWLAYSPDADPETFFSENKAGSPDEEVYPVSGMIWQKPGACCYYRVMETLLNIWKAEG